MALLVLLILPALVLAGCGDSSQVEAGGTVGEAARAWSDVADPLVNKDFADALVAHTALMRSMVGRWGVNQQSFRPPIIEGRRRFRSLLAKARALPSGSQEINDVNRGFVRALELMVSAYDDYLAGVSSSKFERIDAGDEKMLRAQAKIAELRPALDRIFGKPEGFAGELRDLSTVGSLISIQANEALRANSDMLDALEEGRWTRAARKSKEAGRRFRAIVERLERVPEPKDPRLARFLDDLLSGYRLVADGFADYDRGLAARDIPALRLGDGKVRRGLVRVETATERLFRTVRTEATG
jgi:hypothetical protein